MANRIQIYGRLTADVEMRATQEGKRYGRFCVASDRGRKDKDGNRITDFFQCTAWGNCAEMIEKYFRKGDSIIVYGKMQSQKGQKKDGNTVVYWECMVDEFWFTNDKRSSGSGAASEGAASEGSAEGEPLDIDAEEGLPEDLPF